MGSHEQLRKQLWTQQEGQLREGAENQGMLVELRNCRAPGKRCGREDHCMRSLDKEVEELATKVHSTAPSASAKSLMEQP